MYFQISSLYIFFSCDRSQCGGGVYVAVYCAIICHVLFCVDYLWVSIGYKSFSHPLTLNLVASIVLLIRPPSQFMIFVITLSP